MKPSWAIAVLLFPTAIPTTAQLLLPDSLFGTDSRLSANAGGAETFSNFMMLPDGKIVLGGWDFGAGGTGAFNIMVRFDPCGRIDSTFGTDGIVHHHFDVRNMGHAYALQPDGKFLAAGVQAPDNGSSSQTPFVARYLANGSPDTTFADTGTHARRFAPGERGAFYSVERMPNGRILCGGEYSFGGIGLGAMRFMPDGSPDSTFGGDGIVRHDVAASFMRECYASTFQNGDVVVAGRYLVGGNIAHFIAVGFDSTGALNPAFGNAGVFVDTVPLGGLTLRNVLVKDLDDRLVMACTREPNADGIELVRLTPSGAPDGTFGTNGHVTITGSTKNCRGLRLMADGGYLVLGSDDGTGFGFAIRLLSDGSMDASFGNGGYLSVDLIPGSDQLIDMVELPNDRLLFGGWNNDQWMQRYSTQLNVPHISGDTLQLHTTGGISFQWYLDGAPLAGETDTVLASIGNGGYSVEVTDDLGCTYMSAVFTITGMGIGELEGDGSALRVHPNPATGTFTVVHPRLPGASFVLANALGDVVLEQRTTGHSTVVDATALPAGLYIVRLIDGGRVWAGKVMVE